MNSVVSIQGLSKSFAGHSVLKHVDLELPAGTVTVLLGANGSGKSTLVRLLLGLEAPDRGSIRVSGHDPLVSPVEVRRRIGYVPDAPDVYEWMSARELYRFLRPQYPDWDCELERRAAERLEIPMTTPFARLSRGQAASAMLVAALAPRPDLLLLDEAFGGLDALVRDEALAGLLEEIDLDGRAALVVTHEFDLAARIADRVLVLADGRIARTLEVNEIHPESSLEALPSLLKSALRKALVA